MELATSWVKRIALQEASDDGPNVPVEKALRLAAHGYYERAGSILRAWTLQSAMNEAALDEAVTGRRWQSAAAQKPRPKTKPTHRSEIVTAMRRARKDDQTLDQFLESAANDCVEGLTIERIEAHAVETWSVECIRVQNSEGTLVEKRVSRSTLEGWRTAAGKVGKP
jgi:hypothetical protein